MFPDLFTIPFVNLPVHTYGVLIILGFLAALYIAHLQAMRAGFGDTDVADFGFWALLGGILGARVVFILVDFNLYFVERPFVELGSTGIQIPAVLAFWQGGLVFWGSIIGGFVSFMIYTKRRNLARWRFSDCIALGIPLAQMMGRLGCVAAGCCWGKTAYHLGDNGEVIPDLPIYMQFPKGSITWNGLSNTLPPEAVSKMHEIGETLPLFPSQLAEAIGCGMIFLILMFMYSRKKFHGQILLSYIMLYSVMRFVLEYFRGDVARGYVIDGMLSTSQFISLVIVIVGLGVTFVMRQKSKRI